MELNADFTRRAAVHAAHLDWVASPIAGVERRMLDRIGAEVARATSLVRYAPDSHFSPHIHHGGEEFLVLEGVFQDEHGHFPAGSYIRNPPTSRHTPGSTPGCVIFVKLWQFDPNDRTQVQTKTVDRPFQPDGGRKGVAIMPLFKNGEEEVRLERWTAGAEIILTAPGGIEILVLEGRFVEGGEQFEPLSWLRLPSGSPLHAKTNPTGCKLWIKTGHLDHVRDVTHATQAPPDPCNHSPPECEVAD